jgi:hypothetical protein
MILTVFTFRKCDCNQVQRMDRNISVDIHDGSNGVEDFSLIKDLETGD